ncbi:Exosome component 10, partial [Nowakowskiella sp. JEL0407]
GRKKQSLSSAPVIVQVNLPTKSSSGKKHTLIHADNVLRPQLNFTEKVDNSNTPFIRKITYKPHAKRPLEYGLQGSEEISEEMSKHIGSLGITNSNSSLYMLPHPYQYEIENIEYPKRMFQKLKEQLPRPLEHTRLSWVETEDQLQNMLEVLSQSEEIAVDLEHHDYRSFQGFVCLMQISTRSEDFIIDTLLLRSHLHQLNEVFANPEITKVFHGADMDILWLQRDFGVYVVNLFDTFQASVTLAFAHHSLAHLLMHYCSVLADKQFQTADWRIRPLPVEMLKYAQSDTHYLLYIYDRMRNELLEKSNENANLMRSVLTKSEQTALKKFEKEIYNLNGEGVNGWQVAIRKYNGRIDSERLAILKALHKWRDEIARLEDESTRYVLPLHMFNNLVDRMPKDAQEVLSCCTPVPPLVRMFANEIAATIRAARIEGRLSGVKPEIKVVEVKPDTARHIRFEDPEDMEIESENEVVPEISLPELPKQEVQFSFGSNSKWNVQVKVSNKCTLFSDVVDDGYERKTRLAEVTKLLKFTPPGLDTIKITMKVEEPKITVAPTIVPAPAIPPPTTEVKVAESEQLIVPESKPKRQIEVETESTTYSRPADSKKQRKVQIKPVEYDKLGNSNASQILNSDGANGYPKNYRNEVFNPYGETVDPSVGKRQRPRADLQQKSGNKGMSFSKK